MVDAVLLILREVLEAALILSLFLVLSRKLELKLRWCLLALACGFIGSWLVAQNAYTIADAFGGTGQELLNASLFVIAIVSIILLNLILIPLAFSKQQHHHNEQSKTITPNKRGLIYCLFIITVACSITREGSEIWIYLSSFVPFSQAFYGAFIGGVIGAGIGISLGAIAYYLFDFMSEKLFLPIFITVITLVIGGLSMQVINQLMQIGWLDSHAPLWDTSFIVNEKSWLGELLYALIGYDAKPTAIHGIFYWVAITPVVISALWHKWHLRVKNNG